MWHRAGESRPGDSWAFAHNNPKKFRIYGSLTPNVRKIYDNSDDPAFQDQKWIFLGEWDTVKPSGLPLGQTSQEDRTLAQTDGIDYFFPLEHATPVRYLRMDVLETWGSTPAIHITEMTFWPGHQPDDFDYYAMSLNEESITLAVGETFTLATVVDPQEIGNLDEIWIISNENVATVDNYGTVTALSEGIATVTVVTYYGGKTLIAHCSVIVTQKSSSAEISEVVIANVYPNPTDGLINLYFETTGKHFVTISDITGKVLLRQTTNDQSVQLDIVNFPSGSYLLTIDDGKRQKTTKVIKK